MIKEYQEYQGLADCSLNVELLQLSIQIHLFPIFKEPYLSKFKECLKASIRNRYGLLDCELLIYDRLKSLNAEVTAYCAGDSPVLLIDPMGLALKSIEQRGIPVHFFGDPDMDLDGQYIVAIRGVTSKLKRSDVLSLMPRKLIFITCLEAPEFTQDIHDALTVIHVRYTRVPGTDKETQLDYVLSPPYARLLL